MVQYRTNKIYGDTPTTDLFLKNIIRRVHCDQHEAPSGVPCYEYQAAESNTNHFGICNSRARRAGMVGEIHPASLDRSIPRIPVQAINGKFKS